MSAGLVFEGLYGRLNDASITATVTGGIHRDRAPRSAVFPFIVMSVEPVDVSDVLPGEAYFEGDWTVKVVTKGESAKTADDAYALVHARLQDYAITLSGYTTMVCRRASFFSYDEDIEGGERAQHVGGVYHIMAQPGS